MQYLCDIACSLNILSKNQTQVGFSVVKEGQLKEHFLKIMVSRAIFIKLILNKEKKDGFLQKDDAQHILTPGLTSRRHQTNNCSSSNHSSQSRSQSYLACSIHQSIQHIIHSYYVHLVRSLTGKRWTQGEKMPTLLINIGR